MKPTDHSSVFQARLMRGARPSVTIRSGADRRLAPRAYWRELTKLTLRAAWHRGHTEDWLRLLNSHPAFSEMVAHCPRMLYKIYRPYLSGALPMAARLASLSAHYDCIFRRGLAPLVVQASSAALPLAAIDSKSALGYSIDLRAVGTLEREGELVLQLSLDGQALYSVAFTFSAPGEVSIGCIQGSKGEATLELIRQATRELHGSRPKQLLVALVAQLGHALGCSRLRLVSNANRVVLSALRQGRVQSDYDQLWREMGACVRADGDFELPCAPLAAPDLAEVASKKRSEVKKRHAMLAQLEQALVARFCPPARTPLSLAYDADARTGAANLAGRQAA
ncbi:MAG: DUF535 family protein [Massilia sp.]